jgi:UPF0755 protein
MRALRVLVRILLLACLAAAGAAGFAGWRLYEFQRTPHGSADEKVVEVPAGASAREAVRLLAQRDVLADERLAWWWVRWVKRDPRPMKAGEYAFTGPLKPDQVLERLYRGDVKTYHFTVPEGLRLEEIAAIVERAGLGRADELVGLMRDPKVARSLGVPFPNLEGYLFPDTYTFPRNPRAHAVVAAMVTRAKEAWRRADAQRLPGVQLDEAQGFVLASIVEKETGRAEERPHVACVFLNRLKKGMRLATDPTVLYAKQLRTGAWSKNITKDDLTADHPYNTYTRAGLPPGPIASPGQAALAAVLRPADCPDLYFVSRNDGTHEFCPDFACHDAAVKKWQMDYFRERREAQMTTTSGVKAGAHRGTHAKRSRKPRPRGG